MVKSLNRFEFFSPSLKASMTTLPLLGKSCFSVILSFCWNTGLFLKPILSNLSWRAGPPSYGSHQVVLHEQSTAYGWDTGKSTAGFGRSYSLAKQEHKQQQEEHRTALPWGKYAQLIPQLATRSTVNLYSSLTTGSIFVFIQLLG